MNTHSKDAPANLGRALRGTVEDQLLRASRCLGWKAGHRHRGVHQARKSIRRVRSILVLASTALGPGAEALSYLLSGINRGLSRARDAQALVEAIDHLAAHIHDKKWLALLARARRGAVDARLAVLQEAMAEDPDFVRTRNRLAEIKAALDDLAWGAVSSDDVEAAFSRTRNKTGKAAKLATKTGGNEDWHQWRRTARRQSQQQRILAEVGISLAVEYADKEIALLLGRQQDCSLLLEFCQVDQSPIRWTDRNQLNRFVEKKLESLRKALASESVRA